MFVFCNVFGYGDPPDGPDNNNLHFEPTGKHLSIVFPLALSTAIAAPLYACGIVQPQYSDSWPVQHAVLLRPCARVLLLSHNSLALGGISEQDVETEWAKLVVPYGDRSPEFVARTAPFFGKRLHILVATLAQFAKTKRQHATWVHDFVTAFSSSLPCRHRTTWKHTKLLTLPFHR